MKTPEEIKKGLEYCLTGPCPQEECPFFENGTIGCGYHKTKNALTYIQQLEATVSEKEKVIAELLEKIEQLQRERDAAVKDMWCSSDCFNCKYRDNQANCDGTDCYSCELDCPCAKYPCGYEWRGVCLENTEVREDE